MEDMCTTGMFSSRRELRNSMVHEIKFASYTVDGTDKMVGVTVTLQMKHVWIYHTDDEVLSMLKCLFCLAFHKDNILLSH